MSRSRLALLVTSAIATAGLAGPAGAHALTVTSDATGLQMTEPGFTRAAIKLSLVNAGGLKYRVETPNFGGQAITTGAGCTNASTVGLAVAICDRINPVVSKVSLGSATDTFEADPTFPDPIVVDDDGRGPDLYKLGAGNDVAVGGTRDSFDGRAGNDNLTTSGGKLDGGDGNDTLKALNVADFSGRVSEMSGGAGDDVLTAERRAFIDMVGDAGKDSFDGNGATGSIDSRDGVKETVSCGKQPKGGKPVRLVNSPRPFRRAVVDLADEPSDSGLIAGGCLTVDRAPKGEKTAAQLVSTSLKLRRGRVAVKLRCTTSKRCKGKVSVTVKGRTRSKRYSIRGKRTAGVRLGARRGAATVRIREKGLKGPRTTRAALKVTR
jgi:hypothetical protein